MFPGLVLSRQAGGPLLAVLPRPGTGVVATQVWLGAGAAQDPRGRGGLAHFLEHMMFKGTARRAAEAVVAFVEGRGGHLNAHTGLESTAYEAVLPGGGWSRLLAYEADRVTAPAFRELEAERQVILEERRMAVAASPRHRLWEAFAARLFPDHPYGRPVLGQGKEIAAITKGDLGRFFRRHYRPQAATVVLVGDLAPAAAMRRLAALWPHGGRPARHPRLAAPPPPRPGQVEVPGGGGARRLLLGWRTPPWSPARQALGEGLALALTWGVGSLLRERLVEPGICSEVSAWAWQMRKGGAFILQADLAPGAVAASGLDEVLAALRHAAPADLASRVGPVHANITTALLDHLDTAEGAAGVLGAALCRGQATDVARTLKLVSRLDGPTLANAIKELLASPQVTGVLT